MRKFLIFQAFILLLLAGVYVYSQPNVGGTFSGGGGGAAVTLKADCEADGSTTAGALCLQTTDGSLWAGDGTDVNKIGPGTAQTLQQAYDSGSTISGLTSLANGLVLTDDGTNTTTLYFNSGQPTSESDCDGTPCPWIVSRNSGADTITITNASAVTLAGGLKETWSEVIPAKNFDVDGTNCSAPAATTVNSVPMTTITCGDNDSSGLFYMMEAPARWDAGTFTVELTLINANATPANDYDIDWSMQCRGVAETVSDTWGTEVAMDFDFDASGSCGGSACDQYEKVTLTTAAITPTGTCAAGDLVMLRGQLDATGTTETVANVHIVTANLRWTADDWTD